MADPLRVLMLTWDFPATVRSLTAALARAGHEVTVVARHSDGVDEPVDGVRILRPAEEPPDNAGLGRLARTRAVNETLTRVVSGVVAAEGHERRLWDVIHAHGWLVTHAAIALKRTLGVPLVASLSTTEAGRHQGYLPDATNRGVHSVEWWLGHEAGRVLVPSDYMGWEVSRLFDVPPERIDTVPFGIDAGAWRSPTRAVEAARLRFAGEGPLVVNHGGLAAEQGAQDLLAAAAQLRVKHPGTRFVIVGEGPRRATLIEEARRRKLHRAVSFPGVLDEPALAAVLAAADAVVLPARYEPTGRTALEAAAAGASLAVSSIGAFTGLVEPGVNGLRFPAGDVDAIAEATSMLIGDPVLGQTLGTHARRLVREGHAWSAVAASTARVYETAISEEPAFEAGRASARVHDVVLVPPGNLLEGAPSAMLAEADAFRAGAAAARADVRAEVERETAGRVASDALDVLLAATHRS
jgi:glycogen(starch) synthase